MNFRDFLEEVRSKTDILSVFSKYGIQVSHSNLAKCPFHQDSTASLSIKPEWGYWHCFGCGAGGDSFELVQRIESFSFTEAVQKLAHEAGVLIPHKEEEWKHFEDNRKIDEVLTESAYFYTSCITPEVTEYLKHQRGLSLQILKDFRVGYARGGLLEHLIEKGFQRDLCVKAGVIHETSDGLKDFFLNRIIFPTIKRGRVVYLIGRTLGNEEPKYKNLRLEIRYLFNEEALTQKGVFLVEGIPDCLSAIEHGYPAVALLGTNLRHEHIAKFSRCERVFLTFDGDEAGRKANHEIGKLLGDKARIILLPDNTDLDEFLKDRQEQFNELIKSSKDYITYEIELIPETIGKVELSNSLKPILQTLSQIETPIAEAFINIIKKRFKLNTHEIDGYRKKIKDIKESVEEKEPTIGDIKQKYIAYFKNLVDIVEVEDKPLFLIKEKNEFKIVTEVTINGEVYYPPPIDQIPWMLPSGNEIMSILDGSKDRSVKELDAELYDDLCSYHKTISELSNELYYDLFASWDIHTYLMENFQYTPYLCLFAAPEMGKTRTGKGILYVSYRGLHVESLRDAYLIRMADRFKGTIFFDVMSIWEKAEKMGSEDVLLQRFERGAVVPRVNNPERGPFKDMETYKVFGPTIIGTNTGAHRILETRSITITMPKSEKIFDVDVTPAFAISLKERLVAFRARHLEETISPVDKPSADRLGDIMRPLLQVIKLVRPEKESDFMVLLETIQHERKTEKSETIDAEVVKIISGLENRVEFGFLATELIASGINEVRDEKNKMSPRYLGRVLKALGFKKERVGNARGIKWDEKQIEKLKRAFDV